MTETLNSFWNLFLTMNFFAARLDETRLINRIADSARAICREAETEARHGAVTQNVLLDENCENARRSFAAIAVWHHERAARKFREAAALFAEIKNFRVKAKISEHFKRKSKKAEESAARHEAVIRSLQEKNQELFQK